MREIIIYGMAFVLAFGIGLWFMTITIKTIPPIKVQIVGGACEAKP